MRVTAGQADGSGTSQYGGGLYCDGRGSGQECSPQIQNVDFFGNRGIFGGAVRLSALDGGTARPTVTDSRFFSNAGKGPPDVPFGAGGAIHVTSRGGGVARPTIVDATFRNNVSEFTGGAIDYNAFDDPSGGGTTNPRMENLTFVGNASGEGGAIHNRASASASFTATASFVLVNGMFVDNVSRSGGGGAVRNQSRSPASSDASAIVEPTIVNATIVENSSTTYGGGVENIQDDAGTTDVTLENTILWGNRADTNNSGTGEGDQIRNDEAAGLTVNYSIVEKGDAGVSNSTAFADGTGNLKADPLLEYAPLPAGDDGTVATDDDGLHVTPGSPAIDAGNDAPFEFGVAENITTDVTGAARPDGTVDIGAYEGGRDQERTIYVDPSATGAADGTAWADADTTLQDTSNLDSGPFGYATGNDEIRIAEGVYTPQKADTSLALIGGRDGVEVYGGYPAGGGDRDPTTQKTILSGDVGGNDEDSDEDGIIADHSDLVGDNASHVLVLNGGTGIGPGVEANVTGATVIDGVVVTAGQADGAFPHNGGGGLYCDGHGADNACSPTLRRVEFVGNAADARGGAVLNDGLEGTASPSMNSVVFVGNTASSGGALLNDGRASGTASPSLINATFADNEATDGGALYNIANAGTARPSLLNATFSGNSASERGGALYNNGVEGTASPRIVNTILWGNTAGGSGSEIFNDDTANDPPALSHTIIEGGVNGAGDDGENEDDTNTDGGGNLDQDPLLTGPSDPAGADGMFATVDDGLALFPDSPALDAGDNAPFASGGNAEAVTADLTGASRRQDLDADGTATVNIGAYESVVPLAPGLSRPVVASATGAAIKYGLNPAGSPTTIQIRLAPASAPNRDTLLLERTLTGAVTQSVRTTVRRLEPGTTYELEAEATNDEGSFVLDPIEFSLPPAPTLTVDGGSQSVTVRLKRGTADVSAPDTASLYARPGGRTAYQKFGLDSTDVEETSDAVIFEATLPDSMVTPRGVDYYSVFRDGADEPLAVLPEGRASAAERAPLHLTVGFEALSPPTALADTLFPEQSYRMVSIPARNPKPALTASYGPYDASKWRALRWNGGEEAYQEYPVLDSTDLAAGKAFWVVTKNGTPLSVNEGRTVEASTPRRVRLEPGWNQVGTPFGFAVPWDSVRAASNLEGAQVGTPLTYRDGEYRQRSVLAPWQGYFVFHSASEADTLLIPPVGANGAARTKASPRRATASGATTEANAGAGYTLRGRVRGGGPAATAMLGTRPGAQAGRDTLDVAQPPPVEPSIQLSVMQKAGGAAAVPHAKSVKPTGERGHTWILRLHRPKRGETASEVHLDWNEIGSLPEGHDRYVLDLAADRRVTSGTSVSLDKGDTRRLKVIVGTKRYAQQHSDGIGLDRFENELRGNYPNPFDEKTTVAYTLREERTVTIAVYDVLGRRVRTLVDATKSAGLHRVVWDGTNRYGTRVGSGVYFYRIEAGDFTASEKMMLVR